MAPSLVMFGILTHCGPLVCRVASEAYCFLGMRPNPEARPAESSLEQPEAAADAMPRRESMDGDVELLKRIYDRFNARDIDGVLAVLADDVAWANGMDGGHVHGREAVREYWTRQG